VDKCGVERCLADAVTSENVLVTLPDDGQGALYRLTSEGFMPATGTVWAVMDVCRQHTSRMGCAYCSPGTPMETADRPPD